MLSRKYRGLVIVALAATLAHATLSLAESTKTGDQVIDGTSVHATLYPDRGYAIFSNSCGYQTLTQAQLQAGAKPTDIIPCPRRVTSTKPSPSPRAAPTAKAAPPASVKRLWSAIAIGTSDDQIGAALAVDRASKDEAEKAAVSKCQTDNGGLPCHALTAWNAGCNFVSISQKAENLVWGIGSTVPDAYAACHARVSGGDCDMHPIGACYPE